MSRGDLLRALDVAASPGTNPSLLTEQWQLYRLHYLKSSAKLDALSDRDAISLGLLHAELDTNEIDELDRLFKNRVPKCDNSLKQQRGLEPTSEEYFNELLSMCKVLKPQYDELLQTIACPELKLAELKDPERCIAKARLCYRDDYRCLLDIIRGSFICDVVRDMLRVVQHFLDAVKVKEGVRYKNRFTEGDASKSRGYRDLNMNLRHIPTGIVTEVQFHVRSFFDYDNRLGATRTMNSYG
jgi:hypothetical protein